MRSAPQSRLASAMLRMSAIVSAVSDELVLRRAFERHVQRRRTNRAATNIHHLSAGVNRGSAAGRHAPPGEGW